MSDPDRHLHVVDEERRMTPEELQVVLDSFHGRLNDGLARMLQRLTTRKVDQ